MLNSILKKNFCWLALGLLTLAFSPQKVLADEVWSTEQSEEYDVTYQEDRGSTAIWSYGRDGVIFIDGLGGVYTNRGSYTGYWARESSALRCDTFREGKDGEPTYYWGSFEITFLDADFPSRWQARMGLCNRDATIQLNGTPVTQ